MSETTHEREAMQAAILDIAVIGHRGTWQSIFEAGWKAARAYVPPQSADECVYIYPRSGRCGVDRANHDVGDSHAFVAAPSEAR